MDELDENTELIKHPDGYYIKRQKGSSFSIRPIQTLASREYKEPDRHVKKTKQIMKDILECLARGKTISATCDKVGITSTTLRYWRKNDEKFNQACIDAIDVETDNQEAELQERVFRGTRKEVYNGDGELERTEYQQNDQLLLRSLSARRPEKWKQAASGNVNVLNNVGNALTNISIDLNLSTQELSKLGHVELATQYMNMLDNERKVREE
jgi:transposase-like protein